MRVPGRRGTAHDWREGPLRGRGIAGVRGAICRADGMAGRGKLIAVIGDEDTVTGFLLGGIGELNKNRHPNFLVVEKDTTINEIEDTFRYGSL